MKQREFQERLGQVAAIAALVCIGPLSALSQSSGFFVRPLVRPGDRGPRGAWFGSPMRMWGLRPLNNRGDVAIVAPTWGDGGCVAGWYIVGHGAVVKLADFCQETPYGKLDVIGSASINNAGQAAIHSGSGNTPDGYVAVMILLHSNGQLTRIVTRGDPTPIGTTFTGCPLGTPSINDNGEVVFGACTTGSEGLFRDGVFGFFKGRVEPVVISGAPLPGGGVVEINFLPAVDAFINNNGDVLFQAALEDGDLTTRQSYGYFLKTRDTLKKVVIDSDPMPNGTVVFPRSFVRANFNNNSDVVFTALLSGGQTDSGIFVNSNGLTKKIVAAGDPSPLGGTFASLFDPQRFGGFVRAQINDNGAVAFAAEVERGSRPSGIFLANTRAIVKVVAVGDLLPTGDKIKEINSFALNDLGEVAFVAYGKRDQEKPLGVWLASPTAPVIKRVKLKQEGGRLRLQVTGKAFITNDSVIEINGVALDSIEYPVELREDGGTTRRAVSWDARLDQLMPLGRSVQVTVFNSLTNVRSEAVTFTR